MEDVLELQRQFRETVVAWSLTRNDVAIANPLFDRQQQLLKKLRVDVAGRAALEQLFDDEDVSVKAVSATASLAWDSERGIGVLAEIAERNDLIGFEAEITLKSYRSGKLNLDW